MKKFSLVALAALLSIGLSTAQVGIQGGYSSSQSSQKDAKSIAGFHVGPVYNLPIQGPISLQYGLLYNLYMQKEKKAAVGNNWVETSGTSHQIDIPVRVAASFPFGDALSVFVFGGPNFNLGIAGTAAVNTFVDGQKSESLSSSGSIYENKDLSRFNLQLGAGAGLQYNNLGVKLSYDWGMLDMNKDENINYTVNGLKIGLFYNF